jgi:hypothetical protein
MKSVHVVFKYYEGVGKGVVYRRPLITTQYPSRSGENRTFYLKTT